MSDWIYWTLAGLLGVVGAALLVRAFFGDRSSGRRRCPKCWYDMSGVPGTFCCPECGCQAKGEQRLMKTRRHWWLALTSSLFLLLPAGWLIVHPLVRGRGWQRLLPDAVIIAFIDTGQTRWAIGELGRRGGEHEEAEALRGRPDPLHGFSMSQWHSIAMRCVAAARSNSPRDEKQYALGFLGMWCPREFGRDIILGLADCLNDIDEDFASSVASLIQAMGEAESDESLIQELKSSDATERRFAAIVLAARGVSAKHLGSALIEARFEKDPTIRPFVICALARTNIFDRQVATMLVEALDDPNPLVRLQAASGLREFWIDRDEIVQALLRALRDPDPRVRTVTAPTLASSVLILRENKSAVLAALRDATNDSDERVRASARKAVEEFAASGG